MKKAILHLYIPFILAWLATFVVASILQTQVVLYGLAQIDVHIALSDRLLMTWQDIVGLLPTYGLVILVGLAVGFSVAKLITKFTHLSKTYLLPLSGAITMLAILLAMQPILGVTLLAGARTATGIILQMSAGLIGGISFIRIRNNLKK